MKATLTKNDTITISAETSADERARRAVLSPMLQELQAALSTEGTHVLTIVVTKDEASAEAARIAKAVTMPQAIVPQVIADRRAAMVARMTQPAPKSSEPSPAPITATEAKRQRDAAAREAAAKDTSPADAPADVAKDQAAR